MSKWSVVHTVTFLQDAYMIKSYLESAGIETLIPDEFTAQVNNFYTHGDWWCETDGTAQRIWILGWLC